MILVDSSVWVDHFRQTAPSLVERLNVGHVFIHPFIIGEIALGSLRQRNVVLSTLRGLPRATQATDDEVQTFIEQQPLFSLGIGYIDAHLLTSVRLTPGMRLWTRDRRLNEIATGLGIAESTAH